MPSLMHGPLLKLKRAQDHIKDVEAIFRRDIARNAKALGAKHKKRQTEFMINTPDETATVIGDAVHNIRVSLDHAYWIAVEANGGDFHRTVKFPFGGDKASIRASISGQSERHRPSQDVIDFILDEVEPFPDGRLALYELHTLDITDKHQLLLPAHASIKITKAHPLIFRQSNGQMFKSFVGPEVGEATLIFSDRSTPGISIGPGLYLDYKGDLQKAISILFGEGPMKNRPILPALRMLHQSTTSVVKAIAELLERSEDAAALPDGALTVVQRGGKQDLDETQ